ncbi:MAG: TetR/AcrR family transcriptional regulator [Aestuariivirga sp.]|nr:TetR/AcrR family transcriptional regulator [Aestuariivirga sp.]
MNTTKKVGRPRSFDQAALGERAKDLFWARGFEGIGLAELTQALGVKPPSLYAAFGSKAGLFRAALDAYRHDSAEAFAEAFTAADWRTMVRRMLASAARMYTRHNDRRGCLVLDGARDSADQAARDAASEVRRRFARSMAERLTALGAAEPERLAETLIIAMIGLSGGARSGLPAETILAAAEQIADGLVQDH